MKIKVSIIVPVYNVEKYLDECMNSILNQTLKEIEIILVNDGSTDCSSEICEKYARKDSRIRVVQKKNAGLGFARNTGMEIATGAYIGFVDSDDYIAPEMFETLYNKAVQYHVDTAICCESYRVFKDNKIMYPKISYQEDTVFHKETVIKNLLPDIISSPPQCKSDYVVGVSVWKGIYSADLLKSQNIKFCSEREFISEDAIFQLDYFSVKPSVVVIPDIFYYYRANNDSLSMKYKADRFEMDKVLYREQMRKISAFEERRVLQERVQRIFIANVRLCIIQEVLNRDKNKKEAFENIKSICKDLLVQEVLQKYPVDKLPAAKKIMCVLEKHCCSIGLYHLVKLKYSH